MVLKVYSAPFIGPCRNAGVVALVLAEKQVPFEDIPIDIEFYKQKEPEHLARHPFGQVPVLDDNGFMLYEMSAICRYIVEKYPEKGPRLLPGPKVEDRAMFEQAISVEAHNFRAAVVPIFLASLKISLRGRPVNVEGVKEGMKRLVQVLEVYDEILSRQKYVAGNELTIVDYFHLSPMDDLVKHGIVGDVMACETRPNVARWWSEISTRPEWLKLRAEGMKSRLSYAESPACM
uniref:glutathione transferase n=1 Tax=Mycena chlorophos TaxID=658473 RepID=A0ABQ0LVE3_MYCCL|nr:predicted protein [Mycena chlorophos]